MKPEIIRLIKIYGIIVIASFIYAMSFWIFFLDAFVIISDAKEIFGEGFLDYNSNNL